MNRNIKFSIITPCMNSAGTIRRTLQSIINQTYQNFEYIIVDGKSTDGTLKIAAEYKEILQDRMHIISEPDDGIYDAMNKGIKMATGDIIGIVNSDDFYEDDCLLNVLSGFSWDNGKYQILYGGMRCLSAEGDMKSEVFYHHKYLEQQMINHPASFVTKALYTEFGAYDHKYKSAADLDFFLRMKKNKEVNFIPIYLTLTNFRPGGMSGSYIGGRETIIVKYKNGVISCKVYLFDRLKIYVKKILKM